MFALKFRPASLVGCRVRTERSFLQHIQVADTLSLRAYHRASKWGGEEGKDGCQRHPLLEVLKNLTFTGPCQNLG